MRTREELAWVAGFWDGEGCVTSQPEQYYSHPIFSLGQAGDGAPIQLQRIIDATGLIGWINGPYHHRARRKPYWMLRVHGYERVQALVAMCWPWLSEAKKQQAILRLSTCRRLLAERNIRDARRRLECRHGHRYDERNTYITTAGHRRCRRCHADAERRRKARRDGGAR